MAKMTGMDAIVKVLKASGVGVRIAARIKEKSTAYFLSFDSC